MSSESAHEALPPRPAAETNVPEFFTAIRRRRMARKEERLDLCSPPNFFKSLPRKLGVEFRNTIEVDPRILPDVLMTRPVARPVTSAALSSMLFEQRAAVIGGAIVRNISLLVGEREKDQVQFGELPVWPRQVLEGENAKLFSRVSQSRGRDKTPVLDFPEEYIAPPGFENIEKLAGTAVRIDEKEMKRANLNIYTVSGDIVDFWGIEGLTAKIYKHKGKVYDCVDSFA